MTLLRIRSLPHLIGKWGLCAPPSLDISPYVHPADLANFGQLGRVFGVSECVAIEDQYLVLRYGDKRYRITADAFREVPAPSRRIGDLVVIAKTDRELSATIADIHWHDKQRCHIYGLTVGRKHLKRRYFTSDFR